MHLSLLYHLKLRGVPQIIVSHAYSYSKKRKKYEITGSHVKKSKKQQQHKINSYIYTTHMRLKTPLQP
jgi:hypothetical protein